MIFTRRFWPYSGATETHIADLATTLRRAGHSVEILTIRWDPQWPARFQFLEFPVHRVGPAPGPWNSFRFYRNLNRTLIELRPDRMIVFGINEEAVAVARSMAEKIPIVLREDSEQSNLGALKRLGQILNLAETVLVDSQSTAERLQVHLEDHLGRVQVVPMGVAIPKEGCRTPTLRAAARIAVSDAHSMLMIDSDQPLAVCGSPLDGDPGMFDLIDAWPIVLERFPRARLWIVGEGPQGREVWDRIVRLNLVSSVIVPGSFDDLDDVFNAADIYIHPSRSGHGSGFLTRAMAAGLCPVVVSAPERVVSIRDGVDGLVAPPGESRELANRILTAMEDGDLRERLGQSALAIATQFFNIEHLACSYLGPRPSSRVKPCSAESPPLPRNEPSSSS